MEGGGYKAARGSRIRDFTPFSDEQEQIFLNKICK